MSSTVILLNEQNPQGIFVDPSVPLISVDDQGFTRGDGVFETMLSVNRRVRKLGMHLSRLESSARMLDLPDPEPEILRSAVERLMREAAAGAETALGEEHIVKIIISRGPTQAVTSMQPGPYTLIMASPVPLSYAVNMAVLRYVQERGADDAIFITDERRVLEGATSSVLVAKIEDGKKVLYTPEPSHGILPGTTQGAVFEAARQAGWELGFGPLYPQDLFESDGVWLASSVRLIAPVTHLNGTALAHDPELTATLLNYLAQQS